MKAKKQFFSNVFSLGTINFVSIIIPIITLPILTRAIGTELYGQYLLLMTIVVFGQTIIDYSAQFYGIRKLSLSKKNNKFIYEQIQCVRFVCLIIFISTVIVYTCISNNVVLEKYTYLAVIPYSLGYFLLSPWFLIGVKKANLLLFSSLFARLTSLFIIIFFISQPNDFPILVYSSTWPMFISGALVQLYIKNRFHTRLFSIKYIKINIKKGWPIFSGILAPNLYNSIPTIFLGSTSDPLNFAKFAIASRICTIIITFQDVFSKSLYPILVKSRENHLKKILLFNLLISIPATILIFWKGNELLNILIGVDFPNNVYLLIMSTGIIFISISNAYSDGYFLPKKLDSIYQKISIRVSVFSAITSLILIYCFSIVGGAIAITIARLAFALDYSYNYNLFKQRKRSK